jgi:hypothetical protein
MIVAKICSRRAPCLNSLGQSSFTACVCYDCGKMDAQSSSLNLPQSVAKALAGCILIAGTLDLSDALIFYGLRGVPAQRLLQVIASGLIGAPALRLGLPGAALGLVIHYCITSVWSAIFIFAALRFRVLRRFPVVSGLLYGLLIYAVMNYVVLPHTKVVGHAPFHVATFVNGVAALVFCMGLPIAIITRRFFPAD